MDPFYEVIFVEILEIYWIWLDIDDGPTGLNVCLAHTWS